ncbi:MAG: transcription factor [Claussenomyces sp. TS43310]|nr:MAG: transcription factor [Claussenomyces sp. TS43310]
MPPSGRRNLRAKREAPAVSDDAPHTSPTRPSKRKRTKDPIAGPVVEPLKLPRTQAELSMSDEELVSITSQHLLLPSHDVQVVRDHNNDLHQRQSQNVQAYAKITGKDWTYYIKRLRTCIGRPPESYSHSDRAPSTPVESKEGSELPGAMPDQSRVHIDLGPSKLVSRYHAEIYFDSESEHWNIIVNGRNGIKVDDAAIRRGQKTKLNSGHVIEIAGVEMMFVLPGDEVGVDIHPMYLQRAGLVDPDYHHDIMPEHKTSDPPAGRPFSSHDSGLRSQRGLQGQLAIAPAPPDYRKPDTPMRLKGKGGSTSSPYGNVGGTMMVNADQIDFSLDENQHLKPTYTYSQLITQALLSSKDERQTLNAIYKYVADNYSFYRREESQKGWQNSIRHNLSLNGGFYLQQRQSHEPGKGGYWCFAEARRDDLVADAWGGKGRRSPEKTRSSRRSSTPDDSTGEKSSRVAHAPGNASGGSPTRKGKRSPRHSPSPLLSSYVSNGPQFTPDRRNQLSLSLHDSVGDGSPLPRHRRSGNNVYGLSDAMQGSPPVLSSSYAPDDNNSLITPAPVRKHPYLAPPSTAQRPSQHMPTSSPAPFWRYAELGNTPMRPFDLSPTKDGGGVGGGAGGRGSLPQSSSPAPRRDSGASPSQRDENVRVEMPDGGEMQDEEPAFDLTKGFMTIGRYHTVNNTLPLARAGNGRV